MFLASSYLSFIVALVPQTGSGPVFARYAQPLKTASLDLATGTVTRGPRTRDRAGSTVADFANLDIAGFLATDTGNCSCEWFDAGVKGFRGNQSDMMNEIVFAYCTSMLDPAAGGPGGSTKLGFYEGYLVGGGAPTTAVAVFTLTGLPGHTDTSSAYSCYFIQVSFGTMVCFADGPIGYSWKFVDLAPFSNLAATAPVLACVQSCMGPGPDGQGMVDLIDRYCPPGTLRSTFSFGSTYVTSMAMQIHEAADQPALAGGYSGDGVNEDTLAQSGGVVVGSSWSAEITSVNSHGTGGPMSLKVRASTLNGPNFPSPLGGRINEVLVGGPFFIMQTGSHGAGPGPWPFPAVTIPKRFSLIGTAYAAQGTIVGGGFGDLTTAVTGVAGTQ